MPTIEEVRKIFEDDRFATENGAVIDEIGDHFAKCSIVLGERHKNARGAVMGGVVFMLADFAFAVASNWQKPGSVTLGANISFLSAAKGEKLTAEARAIKTGRTTSCYVTEVHDDRGTLVASVMTNGFNVG